MLTVQYNKYSCREHTATIAYLHPLRRNLFSSGYSVQSPKGKVWHSCAFCSWWESLLLDFHCWKKKKKSADGLRFSDMMWKKNVIKISCYHGVSLGMGFQADLASSQVRVQWASREPRGRCLGPRCAEPHPGTGHSGSAEHPLLCLIHHPYSLPYVLMLVATELMETSSQGNKSGELNQEVGYACVIIQCCLLSYCLLWSWVEDGNICSS